MKHYSIWIKDLSNWLRFVDGKIIWSTSRAVIEEYFNCEAHNEKLEIREFIEKEK